MVNEKGFTMVELLGTVVVLGILMVIAIPFVGKYISKAKEDYYKNQKSNIVIATKEYLKNNTVVLENNDDYYDVSMAELVSKKYISIIRDANKDECVGESSNPGSQEYTFVRVLRTENGLKYTAHLWCPNYRDGDLE